MKTSQVVDELMSSEYDLDVMIRVNGIDYPIKEILFTGNTSSSHVFLTPATPTGNESVQTSAHKKIVSET